eukprot:scaffold84687_cov61-Attheya_sp.AAC.4
MNFTIKSGHQYLGGFIGARAEMKEYIGEKADEWTSGIIRQLLKLLINSLRRHMQGYKSHSNRSGNLYKELSMELEANFPKLKQLCRKYFSLLFSAK